MQESNLEEQVEEQSEEQTAEQSIESYCGRCKENREHAIISMEGDKASKVRCRTCGSLHKFRAVVTRKSPKKSVKTEPLTWEARLAEATGKEREYDMTAKYSVGEIVNHNTFGKGIVTKVLVNKCEMLFKDRERLMASSN